MSLWFPRGRIREFWMDRYTLVYLKPTRICSVAQGTLLNVMWKPGWDGVWRRMATCIMMAD